MSDLAIFDEYGNTYLPGQRIPQCVLNYREGRTMDQFKGLTDEEEIREESAESLEGTCMSKEEKVSEYEESKHISELRRRMAAVDVEEAKVICEVLVRLYPGVYVDQLNGYVMDITAYNDVVKTLVDTINDDDKTVYGEER